MQYRRVTRLQTPTFAQGLGASRRMKQLAVDATGQQFNTFEAAPFKLHFLADTGHQRHPRTVVKPAQIMGQQASDATQAVLMSVLREVGMKATDYGNPQPPRSPER